MFLFVTSIEAIPSPAPRAGAAANVFLAVLPDARAREQAAELGKNLCAAHGLKGKLIRPEHLHVSLHPVFDCGGRESEAIARAMDAAARITTPSFDVSFDVAGSFFARSGRYPFVLKAYDGVDRLKAFRRALGTEMIRAGLSDCVRASHTPHMTLIWADRRIEDCPVLPIRWSVRAFVLIRSFVGQTRHEHLASWSLNG